MVNLKNLVRASLMAAVATAAFGGVASAQSAVLNQTLDVAEQSTNAGSQTQRRVDDLDDQRTDIELEYRALLQQIESQRLFVEQQQVFIRSQENELTSLQQQIERVDNIERDLAPMMREMVSLLDQFVTNDLQFQIDGEDGRRARIDRLYELVDDAEVSQAERYRVILNAYEIEASYGRSVVVYEETVLEDGAPVIVDVLRIGRVALIRRARADQSLSILYSGDAGWQDVPSSALSNINRAFRIAEEITTPSVFLVPLPGPSAAQ